MPSSRNTGQTALLKTRSTSTCPNALATKHLSRAAIHCPFDQRCHRECESTVANDRDDWCSRPARGPSRGRSGRRPCGGPHRDRASARSPWSARGDGYGRSPLTLALSPRKAGGARGKNATGGWWVLRVGRQMVNSLNRPQVTANSQGLKIEFFGQSVKNLVMELAARTEFVKNASLRFKQI